MLKPITAIAAALMTAALILPTVSHASEFMSADEPNSMAVSYADLNLASKPAQLTLKRRIVNAAHEVCVYDDTRDLLLQRKVLTCRSDAIAGAQPAYEAALAAAKRGTVTVVDTAASLIVTAP